MNRIISSALATFMLPIMLGTGAKAENNPTPFKLPAAHVESFDAVAGLADNAFASVREFSPFANIDITDENSDNEQGELIGKMTDFASKYLGTRYRRGASGPKAFDCSGFVGFVFKNFGFNLSRSSRSQYAEGVRVDRDDLRPGDLLFFSGRSGRGAVGHVAMVVDVNSDGSCTFIHASTSKGVTYQKFPDGGYYSKRYIGAKRIVGAEPKA